MSAWDSLLSGYSILPRVVTTSNTLVGDTFTYNVVPNLYIQGLSNLFAFTKFVFQAFASSAVLVVLFFGILYVLAAPVVRKLGQL